MTVWRTHRVAPGVIRYGVYDVLLRRLLDMLDRYIERRSNAQHDRLL